MSINNQEKRLRELTKWSPRRKCFDLLSNSLNLFFMEMYEDQFGEFVGGYWGHKGLRAQPTFLSSSCSFLLRSASSCRRLSSSSFCFLSMAISCRRRRSSSSCFNLSALSSASLLSISIYKTQSSSYYNFGEKRKTKKYITTQLKTGFKAVDTQYSKVLQDWKKILLFSGKLYIRLFATELRMTELIFFTKNTISL